MSSFAFDVDIVLQESISAADVVQSDGAPPSNTVWLRHTKTNSSFLWERDHQSFEEVSPSVVPICAPSETPEHFHSTKTTTIHSKGIFGVLPIGAYHSALIYIVDVEPVEVRPGTPLVLPGDHRAWHISSMDYLLLPCKSPLHHHNHHHHHHHHHPSPPLNGVQAPGHANAGQGVPPAALQKYLKLLADFVKCRSFDEGVHFYFSDTADLSGPVPDVLQGIPAPRSFSRTFRWNGALVDAFPRLSLGASHSSAHSAESPQAPLSHHHFVPSIFRGYCGGASLCFTEDSAPPLTSVLICRLSCHRAGTRYNKRGIDALSGIPANFSETTQLLYVAGRTLTSYRILRGSIPRCWDQPADLTFKPTITISPPSSGVNEFRAHVFAVCEIFGQEWNKMHCVDATSTSKLERPLSEAYADSVAAFVDESSQRKGVELLLANETTTCFAAPVTGGSCTTTSNPLQVQYTKYNLGHRMTKLKRYDAIQEELMTLVGDSVAQFSFTGCRQPLAEGASQPRQSGVFRVNCLDCLDRANMIQSMICLHVAKDQAQFAVERVLTVDEWKKLSDQLRRLWALQGTALSGLYAGSEPHFLDLLVDGKRAFLSKFREGCIAVRRFFQQNFKDGRKQDAISLVSRAHNPTPMLRGSSTNPFEREMTNLNRLVLAGLLLGAAAFVANGCLMLYYERYRLRPDFVGFQVMWASLIGVVIWYIRKDPYSFTNYPVLK